MDKPKLKEIFIYPIKSFGGESIKLANLKNFKGLDFFDFDSIYVVYSKIIKTPKSTPFKMKTTTDTPADFRMYGKLIFNLKDQQHELSVY